MKIELRIEPDGQPILFFPDEQNPRNHMVLCYAQVGQHSESSRAYMRQCKRPQTPEERKSALDLLRQWANMPG